MTRLVSRIAARKARLRDALTERFDAASAEDLAQAVKELQALDALGSVARAAAAPPWLAGATVALIAICVTAIAAIARLPVTNLDLDAQVTALEFSVGGDATVSHVASDVPVTNFEVVGGEGETPVVERITSVEVTPGAKLRALLDAPGCITLTVVAAQEKSPVGNVVMEVLGPAAGDELPMPSRVVIEPGMAVRFCTAAIGEYIFQGPVTSLDIARLHRASPPPVRTSSIVSGAMRLNATGQKTILATGDRLRFSEIDNGTMVLFPGRAMRVVFAGDVGRAERLGLRQGAAVNLAPSLLDFATRSPIITSLFGVITGLAGLLWAASKHLDWRSR